MIFPQNGALTTIGLNSFRNCKNLSKVIIPNTITTIGNYAFFDMQSNSVIDVNRQQAGLTLGTDLSLDLLKEIAVTFITTEPSTEEKYVRRTEKIINYELGEYNGL